MSEMTPGAMERLRAALMNSEVWRREIRKFDVMTLAHCYPLGMSNWNETDEDATYRWIEGRQASIPYRINAYLENLRQSEKLL